MPLTGVTSTVVFEVASSTPLVGGMMIAVDGAAEAVASVERFEQELVQVPPSPAFPRSRGRSNRLRSNSPANRRPDYLVGLPVETRCRLSQLGDSEDRRVCSRYIVSDWRWLG